MNNENQEAKPARKKTAVIIVNCLLVLLIVIAIIWAASTYFNLGNNLYTNDAQVEEYINPVNVRIQGYVKSVRFEEHQHIHKGDTLVIIDQSEYKIQLEQAEATCLSAMAARNVTASAVNTVNSNQDVIDANIKAVQARVWNAGQNYQRFANLLKDSAATQQQFDEVKTEYDALVEQRNALIRQNHTNSLNTGETSKRISVNDAEIKRARAAVDLARLNLSYTVIVAPYDGVTGRRNIQEGQLVEPGQNMLSYVRDDEKWVVANYRETQIGAIRVGQKMTLKIDGLDGRAFQGRVVAISGATGSRYAAIPVDNSTGNFVKVQQRIPVKIAIDQTKAPKADLENLRAGMNVEVTKAD